MSRKYKFKIPEGLYFVTFATEGWTDEFTHNEYKNILIDNLAYCQKNKGLEIFAWCIMTNHVHLMVRATEGHLLPGILRDFKKLNYIHQIPVKGGLVFRAEDYVYCSASDYAGEHGLLDICLI